MNPFSKGSPDWSGDINDVLNSWNQLVAGINPSQAALNQASALQNQMTNQQYNQGLSGSTISNQALGSGEMGAFQSDIDKQAQSALQMFPEIASGNQASKMMPWMEGSNLFGMMLPYLFGGGGAVPFGTSALLGTSAGGMI
jgi:hypothetical protein